MNLKKTLKLVTQQSLYFLMIFQPTTLSIFSFINGKSKRRIIKACSIANNNPIPPHNTATTTCFFLKYRCL